jgi:hypothetical protein
MKRSISKMASFCRPNATDASQHILHICDALVAAAVRKLRTTPPALAPTQQVPAEQSHVGFLSRINDISEIPCQLKSIQATAFPSRAVVEHISWMHSPVHKVSSFYELGARDAQCPKEIVSKPGAL